MKPTPSLRTLLFALLAAFAVAQQAFAPPLPITWGPAQNITGDSDILTAGSLVYAYNFGNSTVAGTTINGVTFAPFALPNSTGSGLPVTLGSVSISESPGDLIGNRNYGGATGNFTNLSTSYQSLLNSGASASNTGNITLQLGRLTLGRNYHFQWWANDSKITNDVYYVIGSDIYDNNLPLLANTYGPFDIRSPGKLGQFATGNFTAVTTNQTIQFSGVNSYMPLINGFQLRVDSQTLYWLGSNGTSWTADSNWSTTSSPDPISPTNFSPGDSVAFPAGSSNTSATNLGGDQTVSWISIDTSDDVGISGGNLTISGPDNRGLSISANAGNVTISSPLLITGNSTDLYIDNQNKNTISSISSSNPIIKTGSGAITIENRIWLSEIGGSLEVQSGNFISTGGLSIGVGASNETMTVNGTGTAFSSPEPINVGVSGNDNTLAVENGASASAASIWIGGNSSAQNNSVTVNGTGSSITSAANGSIAVGYEGSNNTLTISNGGSANASSAYIGFQSTANNNSALVTGTGSALSTSGGSDRSLAVGFSGSNNSLTVSDGGAIVGANATAVFIGYESTANNNTATVTGANSTWTNAGTFHIGYNGTGNTLAVEDGGLVQTSSGDVLIGFIAGSNNNALTINGTGSLFAVGDNKTLYVGNNGAGNTLSVTNGGNLSTFNSRIGGGTSSNNNTLTVSGTGSTWNNAGTLRVGSSGSGNSLNIIDGATASVVGNMFLGYNSGSANNTVTVNGTGSVLTTGNLTVGRQGTGTLAVNNGGKVLVLGGIEKGNGSTVAIGQGGTLQLGNGGAGGLLGISALQSNGTIIVNSSSSYTYNGSVSGTGNFIKDGTGTLTVTGNQTYSGGTAVNGGTLALGASNLLLNTGNLSVAGGSFDLGAFQQAFKNVTLSSGSITGTNGTITAQSYAVESGNASANLAGNASLTKSTSGTVILSGSNSYTGTTSVNAGTLQIGSASGLGSGGNITFGGGILQYGSGITSDLSSRIKNSGSAIAIDTNSNNVTFGSLINSSNTGGLAKFGDGTLTLTANNTYTGGTFIESGTLAGNSDSLKGSITNNATLRLGTAGTYQFNTTGSGALLVAAGNNATTTLLGNATMIGGTTIESGSLTIGGILPGAPEYLPANYRAGSISGNIINEGTLVFDQSTLANRTYSGIISGNGSLKTTSINQFQGYSGQLFLTNNNTFTGGTFVSVGTVDISGGSLAANGNVTVSGGTFAIGASNQTIGNFTLQGGFSSGSGSLTASRYNLQAGSVSLGLAGSTDIEKNSILPTNNSVSYNNGVVYLTGNNTSTGNVTINSGILSFDKVQALYSGNNASWTPDKITVAANATLSLGVDGNATSGFSNAQIAEIFSNLTQNGTGGFRDNSKIGFNTGSGNFTLTTNITDRPDGGVLGMDKIGYGNLILDSNSTFSGELSIFEGKVILGRNNALRTDSDLVVNLQSTYTPASGFDVGNYTQQFRNVTLQRGIISGGTGSIIATGNYTMIMGNATANLSGNASLVKTNTRGASYNVSEPESVFLSGNNSYTGTTTVQGVAWAGSGSTTPSSNPGAPTKDNAKLQFQTAGSLYSGDATLWTAENIIVKDYGILSLRTGSTGFNGTQVSTIIQNLITANRSTGGFLDKSVLGIDTNGEDLVINDDIGNTTGLTAGGGAVGLIKYGSGTLTLNGNSTRSFSTSVTGGNLVLGANATLSSTSANLLVDSAVLDIGATNQTVRKVTVTGGSILGSGTLTSSADGFVFGGGANITANLAGAVGATIDSTTTLGGNNSFTGNTTIGPAATLRLANVNALSGSTLIFQDFVSAPTLQFALPGANTYNLGGLSGAGNLNTGNNSLSIGANSQNTTYSGVLSGTGSLTKVGNGTFTLAGSNTYTGGSTISAGKLQIGNNGTSGFVTGNITNNADLVFYRTDSVTYSGMISGTGNVAQQGPSTLTLSGSNTYSGNTTIGAGATLSLGNVNALSGSTLIFGNNPGSSLQFSVGGANTYNLGGLSGAGNITMGANSLSIGANSQNTTYSGVLSGTGSLAKVGDGTLTLSGSNSYTGGTTISAGTLSIGNGGTTGSLTGNITNNSALVFNRSTGSTYTGAISGNGSIEKLGSGILTLSGGNHSAGATTINGGGLTLANSSTFNATGSVGVNTGALTIGQGGSLVVSSTSISQNTQSIFVSNEIGDYQNTISVFDLQNSQFLSRISGNMSRPTGVAIDGSGNIFVANYDEFTLSKFSSNGTFLENISGMDKPYGVAIDGSGNIYVANYGDDTLSKFSSNGSIVWKTSGNMTAPYGVAIDGSGNIFVANSGNDTLSKFSTNGTFDTYIQVDLSPTGVAIDGSGNIYVANSGNEPILSKFSSNGSIVWSTSGNMSFPNGVAIDGSGNIYVANNNDSTLSKFSSNGTFLSSISGNMSSPWGVAIGNYTTETVNLDGITLAASASDNATLNMGTYGGNDTTATVSTPFIAFGNGTAALNLNLAGNLTLSAALTGGGANSTINQLGTGTTTLNSANSTYAGSVNINSGTLKVNTSLANATFVVEGGTLGGNGTLGDVTINNGGTIAPGNSPGTITVGNMIWNGGGTYAWELGNANGTAGTGWDLINSTTGNLTINANSGAKFTIAASTNNATNGFDPNAKRASWKIAEFANITGFASDAFNITTTGFGTLPSVHVFYVSQESNALNFNYATMATWNAGTGNWTTASNWEGDFAPVNGVAVEYAGPNGTNGTSTNNDANLATIASLAFTSSANGSFTVAGGNLTLGSGGIVNNSTFTQTVGINLALGANQTFAANSANLVVIGNISGGYALTKEGNQTLVLAGANSYTGSTSVSNGTVVLTNRNALYGGNTTNWTADNITVGRAYGGNQSGTLFGVSGGPALVLKAGGAGQFTAGDIATLANNLVNGTVSGNMTGQTGTGFASQAVLAIDTTGGNITMQDALVSGTNVFEVNGTNRTQTYSLVKLGSGTLNLGGNASQGPSGVNSFSFGDIASVFSGGDPTEMLSNGFTSTQAGTLRVGEGVGLATPVSFVGGAPGDGATLQIDGGGMMSVLATVGISAAELSNLSLNSGNQTFPTFSGQGVMNVTGGNVTSYLGLVVGGAAGQLNISGGDVTAGSELIPLGLVAGVFPGTNGTINVSGGNLTASNISLGGIYGFSTDFGGNGTLNLSAGNLTAGNMAAGVGNGSLGIVKITGGNATAGSVILGAGEGSAGGLLVSGGTLLVTGQAPQPDNRTLQSPAFVVGGDGYGLLSINGTGKVIVAGALSKGNQGDILLESGGTLQIGYEGADGSLETGLTNNGTLVFDVTGEYTHTNSIGGMGVVNKTGNGTLVLSGSLSNYSGATTIQAGTLQLDGTYSNTASAISINGNGTLAGSGTAGDVTVLANGIISPNASNPVGRSATPPEIGTLTVGNLTLSGGGIYNWQLASATGEAGTDWDLISATGGISINATSGNKFVINATDLGESGFNPAARIYTWTIAESATGITGFAADKFAINTTGFEAGIGAYFTSANSTALNLNYATVATWNAGTGNWTTASNWEDSFGPINGVAVEYAGPNGSGGTSTNNDIGLANIRTLEFTSGANASYTLAGGNLTIESGIVNNSTFTQTVGINLALGANQTFAANTANLIVSGNISGGYSLTKEGNQTLTLSGANTYTGGTTISAGTVSIGNGGTTGSVTGDITNNATLAFNRSDAVEYAGVVSGTGTLEKLGAGTLTLSADNIYTGNTTISSGTLQLGNGGTNGSVVGNIANNGVLAINRSDDFTFTNTLTGTGSVVKLGTNTLTYDSTSPQGGTFVEAGTLLVTGSTSSVTVNSTGTLAGNGTTGNVTINSGGAIAPGNSPGTITVGNLTLNGGAIYNWQTSSINGTAGTDWDLISSAGTLSLNATGPITISLSTLGNATLAGLKKASWEICNFTAGISGFNKNAFSFNATSMAGNDGRYYMTLGAGNTTLVLNYKTAATWNTGNGVWTTPSQWEDNSLPTNGDQVEFTGIGGTSTNNFASGNLSNISGFNFLEGAGAYIVNGNTLQIGEDGIINASNNLQTIGMNLTAGEVLTVDTTGAGIEISGVISGNSALTKIGTQTLALTGNNSYTGGTTVSAGTLAGTTQGLQGAIVNNAVVNFNQTFNGTYLGSMSGSGSLVKTGNGAVLLSGSNTYSGGTSINAGVLAAAVETLISGNKVLTLNPNAFGNGSVTINSGGTMLVPSTTANGTHLTIRGNLSLNNGAIAFYDIGESPEGQDLRIDVTGSFSAAAGNNTFDFSQVEALNYGNYTLVNATSISAGGATFLATHGPNTTLNGTFSNSTNNTIVYTLISATSSGSDIQNNGGPNTPIVADYTISVPTITVGANNTVNALTFTGSNSLTINSTGQLTVTSGTLNVQNGSSVVSGGTLNTGNFSKTGEGRLNLQSNTNVNGIANVVAGILSVNGQFTANSVVVDPNGTLGGSGLIVAQTVRVNGNLSPGNSPGTLTVAGNLVLTGANSTIIEIASPTVFDRIVVGGQITLGGKLNAVAYGGGTITPGTRYDFLQAGSIVGAYDSLVAPDGLRIRFLNSGTVGTLLFGPESFVPYAQNQNQINVAKALDIFVLATKGDAIVVGTALDSLTTDQYPAAFNAIMPGFYESLMNMAIEQAFGQTQMLNQRISSVRLGAAGFQAIGGISQPLVNDKNGKSAAEAKDASPIVESATATNWNAWALGTGMFSRTANLGGLQNYNNDAGGFLVGSDYRWSENFVTGLYAGYDYSYAKYNGGGSTRGNSVSFGTYASYAKDGYYADAVIGGGYTGYQTKRAIQFGTIDRTASADPNSGQFTAGVNLGKDFEVGKFTLGPIVGAQYTYAGIGSFTESGADSLDLALGQQNANSLRSTLGGRIAYTWNLNQKIALIPEVRMFWQHEFLNNPRTINSSLDGGNGPSFGYETITPYRDSVFAGAGVTAQFGKNLSGSVFYNINFGSQTYQSNMVSAGLNFSF